jgi:hypothetical protein
VISSAHVLAHQGGWDEMLMVLVPILIFAVLLVVANRRASRIGEQQSLAGDGAGPGPGGGAGAGRDGGDVIGGGGVIGDGGGAGGGGDDGDHRGLAGP